VSEVIEAVFEQGVFRPREAVMLPEGQVVRVLLPGPPPRRLEPSPEEKRSARAALMSLAGMVNSGDPDAANNERIDADLAREYGTTHDEEG